MIVACGMARCRIASRMARRVREGLVPGTAAGMIVVCRMARCRIACGMARRLRTSRRVPARVCRSWSRLGTSHARHLPCPGPTYACSRRRQSLFTNIYSFARPWRFIEARSAARLRRTVGPPSPRHVDAEPSGQSERSRITTYHWG